jgi:ABC-type arginine transport system permease subunit
MSPSPPTGIASATWRDAARGVPALINLSDIDFDKLAKRFEKSNRKNVELEQLRVAIMALHVAFGAYFSLPRALVV